MLLSRAQPWPPQKLRKIIPPLSLAVKRLINKNVQDYVNPMVIVTGAAGFIGSQIAAHLAQKSPQEPLVLGEEPRLFAERNYLASLTSAGSSKIIAPLDLAAKLVGNQND